MGYFLLFFALFILFYGLTNYYIGLRIWQYLSNYLQFAGSKSYWLVFWVIALSYILARLSKGILPDSIRLAFTYLGSYWLAAFVYLALGFALLDAIRIILNALGLRIGGIANSPLMVLGIMVLTVLILVYGTWNARNPVLTTYQLTISKEAGGLRDLHAVMVADLHLGPINTRTDLAEMVEEINALGPDLVLIAGDIIDEDVSPAEKRDFAVIFRRLQARYGVYAVPGNHDQFDRQTETAEFVEISGMQILKDKYLEIADSFYIVGRDDPGHDPQNYLKVRSLEGIMEGIDRQKPIFLLKHQPVDLAEAERLGVDLQLSGHTHQGQIYPGKLITSRMYEKDWGHLQRGSFNLIVSSGYGTWGPPIRTGNRPEIADIRISFQSTD